MSMDHSRIETILGVLRDQSYPLTVSEEAAEILVECMRLIMDEVPEDEQVFLRYYYDLATSALMHPSPEEP